MSRSKQVSNESKMFSLILSKQMKWLQLVHITPRRRQGEAEKGGEKWVAIKHFLGQAIDCTVVFYSSRVVSSL